MDHVLGREFKKIKHPDTPWHVTGSNQETLVMAGLPAGPLDWTRSRYLRVGHELNFFAFVTGSQAPGRYMILAEKNRDGYVEPKQYTWHDVGITDEDE